MSEATMHVIMQSIPWVILIMATILLPMLRRKSVSFGIALPIDKLNAPEVLRIRRRYMLSCAVIGAAELALGLSFIGREGGSGSAGAVLIGFLPLVYLFIATLLFIRANRQTARLKAELGWQVPEPRFVAVDTTPRRFSGAISIWWYTIPIGLILLEAGILAVYYDRLPDILNVHYHGSTVDRVEPKSLKTVFLPNLIQLLVVGLLAAVSQSIKTSKRELDPNDPEGSSERSRRLRRNGTFLLWGISLLTTVEFGLVQFGLVGWLSSNVATIAAAVVMPLVFIGFAIAFAAKMSMPTGKAAGYGTPVNDDRFWKAGLFYFNPDDPAVIVEKRVGIGWTVNFGHPIGWLVLASPLLVALITLLISLL